MATAIILDTTTETVIIDTTGAIISIGDTIIGIITEIAALTGFITMTYYVTR